MAEAYDQLKWFMRSLINQKWKMHEIDDMDVYMYWDLMAMEDTTTKEDIITYADDVPWL